MKKQTKNKIEEAPAFAVLLCRSYSKAYLKSGPGPDFHFRDEGNEGGRETFKGRVILLPLFLRPFGLNKMMETGETFPKKEGRTKSVGPILQAYLPQSSRALLLVNVNEVANHSSLKGAVLCLHPYLDMILKTNMRRQLACLPKCIFFFILLE